MTLDKPLVVGNLEETVYRMMILDKITGIEERYEELNHMLMEVGDDYQRAAELGIERAELEPLVLKSRQYRHALAQLDETRALLEGEDDELKSLAEAEIADLEPRIDRMEHEIKSMLLPQDPRHRRNVIVEIRAGTGGDEAALFASDLFRMYSRFAERQGWSVEILSANEIGIGGYKEIIFLVKGRGAYSRLKYESGVHRVQRVPVTESQGRIHTSTATVAVLAEVDEVEIGRRAIHRLLDGRSVGPGPPEGSAKDRPSPGLSRTAHRTRPEANGGERRVTRPDRPALRAGRDKPLTRPDLVASLRAVQPRRAALRTFSMVRARAGPVAREEKPPCSAVSRTSSRGS